MKVAIGQDSHRFDFESKNKNLVLGGIVFENATPTLGNKYTVSLFKGSESKDFKSTYENISLYASNIVSSSKLGKITDEMCKNGITDSEEYVKEALKYLNEKIIHISISIECKTPKISPKIEEMRKNIARILNISENSVGITATTGEGLTEFGKGNGISVFSCITVE